MEFALVLVIGLAAGALGGVVGFGTSIMLMPVLMIVFGPREAVPIMAVASIMANASRVLAGWRVVDWPAVRAYSVTAVPAAVLGARTLLAVPPGLIETVLGVFFIGMIPLRRWMAARHWHANLWHLAIAGAGLGFLTGLVASTGPINAPIFLAHGLVKGAYLASEALGSLAVYLAKAAVFHTLGALPVDIALKGLIVGGSVTVGSFAAKGLVGSIDPARFRVLMDLLLLVAGCSMLWTALRTAG